VKRYTLDKREGQVEPWRYLRVTGFVRRQVRTYATRIIAAGVGQYNNPSLIWLQLADGQWLGVHAGRQSVWQEPTRPPGSWCEVAPEDLIQAARRPGPRRGSKRTIASEYLARYGGAK
jgi:hypothetical protein